MGIENAKLVAIPLKVYSKAEVLEKMEERCNMVMDLISEAHDRDIADFSMPVCLGVVTDVLLEDEYTRCSIPTEEDIEAMLKSVIEKYGEGISAKIEEYYWDGDLFACDVRFTGV